MTLTQITEKGIKDGEIINADINASAAIARTKLANVDLVDDTSPQLGGDLQSNGNDVDFADNDKAIFGTGSDLQLYHGGTNSVIQNSTGDLYFKNTNNLFIQVNDSEAAIYARPNGSVELYHDGGLKFDTVSGGARIYGYLSMQGSGGHIYLPDSAELKVGSGEDLTIYHNGSHAYIENDTGTTYIRQNSALHIQKIGASEKIAEFNADADVELYYDGSKKFETTTNGIKVVGAADAGGGADSGNIQMMATSGRKNTIGNHFATNAYDSRIEFGVSDSSTSGGTNRVASFSYAGLSFGTDTANANRLDDYEEGSWTPTVEGTTTTGTVNYVARGGYYTKIGNKVFWEFYINYNSGNGSGTIHISGLPYTVSNNGTYPSVNIGYVQQFSLRSNHHLYGLHASNSNYLYFYEMPDGGGSNVQPNYDGSGSLIMSGHYEVA